MDTSRQLSEIHSEFETIFRLSWVFEDLLFFQRVHIGRIFAEPLKLSTFLTIDHISDYWPFSWCWPPASMTTFPVTFLLACTWCVITTENRHWGLQFSHWTFWLLKPQANSLLFAAVLLLLQPIQIEEVDLVFQIGGLKFKISENSLRNGVGGSLTVTCTVA